MKSIFWILLCLILTMFIYLCTPVNPSSIKENAWANIIVEADSGILSTNDNLADSTEKAISLEIRHYLPEYIDSANISMLFPDGHEEYLVPTLWPGMDTTVDTSIYTITDIPAELCRMTSVTLKLFRCGSYSLIAKIKRKGNSYFDNTDTLFLQLNCSPVKLTSLFGTLDLATDPPLDKADSTKEFRTTVGSEKTDIDVLPQTDNPYVHISINNVLFDKDSIRSPWPLSVGENRFNIVTFADDSSVTDTVFLLVFRKASTDAVLDSLYIPGLEITPTFSPNDTVYHVKALNKFSTVNLIAKTRHANAMMRLNDSVALLSTIPSDTLSLNVGKNMVTIDVSAEDSITKRRYSITIERMQDSSIILKNVSVDSCNSCITFLPEQRFYEFPVDNSIPELLFTFTKQNKFQTISITSEPSARLLSVSGEDSLTARASFSLMSNRSNVLNIKVTSESGFSGEYQFKVFRKPGTIATLDSIVPSVGSLAPLFTRENLRYSILIPSSENKVSIRAVPTNTGASMLFSDVSGKTRGNNFERTDLSPGENSGCFISVTPEDKDSIANGKNYVVDKIIRAYPLIIVSEGNGDSSVTDSSDIFHGVQKILSAAQKTGYVFREWQVITGNAKISSAISPVCTVTTLSPCSLKAIFVPRFYSIVKQESVHGTFSAPDSVRHAYPCTLSAQPHKGYRFTKWQTTSPGVIFSDNTSPTSLMTCTENDITLEAGFDIIAYQLTVESDDNGVIINAEQQNINFGDTTLIAVQPKPGYHFDHWSIIDGYVKIADSTLSSTSILMDSTDARIKAICELNTYHIDYLSQNGHIVGDTSVLHGKLYSVLAAPDDGYVFDRWVTTGGMTIDSSTNATATIVVTGSDAALEARFMLDTYHLSTSNNDSGSVDGAGDVLHSQRRAITASPATGFHFVKWLIPSGTAEIIDASNAATVVILTNGDAAVEAVFERNDYHLSVESEGNGSAGSSGMVKHALSSTITATANVHSHFLRWSLQDGSAEIADTSSSAASVRVFEDSTVIRAIFAIDTHTLLINAEIGGNATGAGNRAYGSTDSIFAHPDYGYHFSGWKAENPAVEIGDRASDSTSLKLLGEATITAAFSLNEYSLKLTQTSNGEISMENGDKVSVKVLHGQPYTIKALPDAENGFHFVKWKISDDATVKDTAAAITEITVSGDSAVVEAEFVINRYSWKVVAAGLGTGTVECKRANGDMISDNDLVTHGEVIEIHALPAFGCSLSTWVANGNMTIEKPLFANTFSSFYADTCFLTVDFALKRYALTVNPPINAGTSTFTQPANPLLHGIETIIAATPGEGYRFVAWTKVLNSDSIVFVNSIESQIAPVKMLGNATIQPMFEKIPFQLSVVKTGDGFTLGTIAPEGVVTVRYGELVTLTATAQPGATFFGWERSAGITYTTNQDSTKSPIALTIVNQDTSIKTYSMKARFNLREYDLFFKVRNATDNTESGGTIKPSQKASVKHGISLPVKAKAGTGYKLNRWIATANVTITTTEKPDSIMVSVNGAGSEAVPNSITAEFTLQPYNLKIVQPDPAHAAIINPSKDTIVEYSKNAFIQARMKTGYTFDHWVILKGSGASFKGSFRNISDSISLSKEDVELGIAYHENEYPLTIGNNTPSWGTVVPDGVSSVKHFSPFTVMVNPNSGFTFDKWSDDTANTEVKISLVEANKYQFTLIKAAAAKAVFKPIIYPFAVKVATQGDTRLIDFSEQHIWNDRITINAQAAVGWHFVQWKTLSPGLVEFVDGTTSLTPGAVILQKDFPMTMQPEFAINTYQFTMQIDDPLFGTVTPSPATMEHGRNVLFTATSYHPYRFKEWLEISNPDSVTIANTVVPSTTISIINNATVKAFFELKNYNVTAAVIDPLRGSVLIPDSIAHSLNTSIMATSNPGFKFARWAITSSGTVDFVEPYTVESPTAVIRFVPDTDIHDTKITAIFDAE